MTATHARMQQLASQPLTSTALHATAFQASLVLFVKTEVKETRVHYVILFCENRGKGN